jgi:Fe-Mn family superoxide dismutase
MSSGGFYQLPKLPYGYSELQPYISEDQLRLHYEKHHQAYINGANAILKRSDQARRENEDFDVKAAGRELSFNIGGHLFHSLFWGILAPPGRGGGEPFGAIGDVVRMHFGSFEGFKKEFCQAALSIEGCGWATVSFCTLTKRPYIIPIEKHNVFGYPMYNPILALDVFEHAYYLDYKNDRARYVDAFWNLVNWAEINKIFEDYLRGFSPEANPYRNLFITGFPEYPF